MKTILMLLSNGFHPDPRPLKEAKTLVKSSYKVEIHCLDRQEKLPQTEEIDGITVVRYRVGKLHSGNIISMPIGLKKFYKKVRTAVQKKSYHAIHAHDFDTLLLGLGLARKKKIPLIYDCHDLYYTQVHTSGVLGTIARYVLQKLEFYYAKKAEHIITVTESVGGKHQGLKEIFLQSGAKNVTVIWNYPEKNFVKQKEQHKIFRINFIGSVRFLKGFQLLFSALKEKKDVELHVVGDGVYLEELKTLAKKQSMPVLFYGRKPSREVPQYYAQSDLTLALYDTSNENIKRAVAVKQFDSQLAGIPTLVDKDTLGEDYVNVTGTGIAVRTVQEVQEAIERVQKEKEQFENNCLKAAKKTIWEAQEKKLLKLYKQVLQ